MLNNNLMQRSTISIYLFEDMLHCADQKDN